MRHRKHKPDHEQTRPGSRNVEVRNELQDASKGKDLSYLNEMPQMSGYEGVKAGVPPRRNVSRGQSMADES